MKPETSTIVPSNNKSYDWRRVFDLWLALSTLKLLLFHAYKSTDFEVHRNWMALTNSLPLKEWYYEATSVWTLDYPPFFAYFEWLLSLPAKFVDKEMLRVDNLDYSANSVIFYQRLTVIFSDIIFLYGCHRYMQAIGGGMQRLVFVYASASLIILDNIHFQYNSMMYGILILSIAYIKEDSYFKSALAYAVLLNFKHIFLYFAPCFGLFYLRQLVFSQSFSRGLLNLILLGVQTITIFMLSFGPFIYYGGVDQLLQMKSRLFPFGRGLVHNYWAANFWALYTFFNEYIFNIYNWLSKGTPLQCVFDVDAAQPLSTYQLWTAVGTAIFMIPIIVVMLFRINRHNFNFYLAAANFIAFNFGFHVHEKAILMTVIPLMLEVSQRSDQLSKVRLLVLKSVAVWTLLPLLISEKETVVKHLILIIDMLLTIKVFLKINISEIKPLLLKWFVYGVMACIFLLQAFQIFYIEIFKHRHEGLMHRYQDLLPFIASLINQLIFLEMIYRCIISPCTIPLDSTIQHEKIE